MEIYYLQLPKDYIKMVVVWKRILVNRMVNVFVCPNLNQWTSASVMHLVFMRQAHVTIQVANVCGNEEMFESVLVKNASA